LKPNLGRRALRAVFRRAFSSVIGSTASEYKAFIEEERLRQLDLIRATNFTISD